MAQQLSVFLENKAGHIKKVTSILKGAHINIRTMTLSTTTLGWGVLNLVVNNPQKAFDVLKQHNLSVELRGIVALRMLDEPGGLDEMLTLLDNAEVNIENAYGRVVCDGESAFLVIDVEDINDVEQKLRQLNIEILDDNTVYGIK